MTKLEQLEKRQADAKAAAKAATKELAKARARQKRKEEREAAEAAAAAERAEAAYFWNFCRTHRIPLSGGEIMTIFEFVSGMDGYKADPGDADEKTP